jgi:uncharacterized membrane protein YeaQ/YmgE (transglycosylase-associated protein family)
VAAVERDLFFWILAGLVIGTVAKLLLPGREPGGFVLSLLLGIAGALAGGFLLVAMAGNRALETSLLAAAVGAVLALALYRIVIRSRSR